MVTIIGHGLLSEYSRTTSITIPIAVEELIQTLSIPKDLCSILIPVKGTKIINLNDTVYGDDIIHLYMSLNGG